MTASLIERLRAYLYMFPPEAQAHWTYDNWDTRSHALLRDCLAALLAEAAPAPMSNSPILMDTTRSQQPEFISHCTEPEFPAWWEQFGKSLVQDTRLSVEMVAMAAWSAGAQKERDRGKQMRLAGDADHE